MDFQKCPVCESNIIRLPEGKKSDGIEAHALGANAHENELSGQDGSPHYDKDIEFKKINESGIESSSKDMGVWSAETILQNFTIGNK